jgi:hypothetical protein
MSIGFSITAKLGNSLSALGRVATRINNLGNQKAEGSKKAKTFGQRLQALSTAMGRLGGQAGALAGRLGGGAGMAGSLGRVAVAAGLAAVAFRAYMAVQAASERRTRAQIAAERELTDTLRRARGQQAAAGQAGRSTAEGMRAAVAAGVDPRLMLGWAQQYGTDVGSVVTASTAHRKHPGAAPLSHEEMKAASMLAQTGRADFGAAAEHIAGNRGVRAGTGAADIAARAARGLTGERITADQMQTEAGRVRQDPLMQRLQQLRGIETDTQIAQVGQVQSGAIEASMRDALSQALDPTAHALAEMNRQRSIEIAALERLAERQGTIAALFSNVLMVFGLSDGSADQQLNRAQIDNAHAVAPGSP